jgi:crotonobetainyl-CoA:carnitine CoA-transferase CaiB-like acyl-CoA transferase
LRDALLRLARHYDVVVESFRPGVLDKLGVGFAALRGANPRIIMLSISGYGQDGPLRDRAGQDLNYIALGGVLGLAGPPDRAPPTPAVQLADIAGGALFGAVGILAALYERERTGSGQQVDVSMCEGALAFLIPELGNYDASGQPPRRGEELLNGGAACYGVYRTKDGRFLSVATQRQVRAEIQAILETKTRDEWEPLLVGDVCVEPVLAVDELAAHPQHRARGLFFDVDGLRQTRTPLGGAAGHRRPPTLGGDGTAILREAGFSDDDIARLQRTGVTR